MKLLAILKDSLRETIDSRVFTVLLALSVGVLLLFGSMTFTPVAFSDLRFTLQTALNPTDRKVPVEKRIVWMVRGLEPVNGPANDPATIRRLTIGARYPTAEAAEEVRHDPDAIRRFLDERVGRLDDRKLFHVAEWKFAGPDNPVYSQVHDDRDVFLEVTIRPTMAVRCLWPHESSLLFGQVPLAGLWSFGFQREETPSLGFQLWFFEDQIINGPLSWGALLVSVIVTSFFIPNMMQRGRLDLLLAKPITRPGLLVYKYLGGLLFIFLNASFAISGCWVVLGLRSGVWDPTVLLTILVITFFFAVLYAVSTLVAVLTRNGVIAILATCFVWLLLFGVGRAYISLYENDEKARLEGPSAAYKVPDWAMPTATAVHHLLPRTNDFNPLITRLLAESLLTREEVHGFDLDTRAVNWTESLGVSFAFIALFLGLACWRFWAGDY